MSYEKAFPSGILNLLDFVQWTLALFERHEQPLTRRHLNACPIQCLLFRDFVTSSYVIGKFKLYAFLMYCQQSTNTISLWTSSKLLSQYRIIITPCVWLNVSSFVAPDLDIVEPPWLRLHGQGTTYLHPLRCNARLPSSRQWTWFWYFRHNFHPDNYDLYEVTSSNTTSNSILRWK